MVSPPTRDKKATLPLLSLLAFLPLASATRRVAATHALFTASLPTSLPAHGASADSASYCTITLPENYAPYDVPTDFVLMNTASPPNNLIAFLCAHADSDYQLQHPSHHYIHEHDVTPTRCEIYSATLENGT